MPPAPDLAIRDVAVVDPLDGSVRPGSAILVRDGRIVQVGRNVAPATVEVDGAGRFAVPGYQNMHSHALGAQRPGLFMATMLAEGVTGFRQMNGSPQLLADRAARRLPLGRHTPGLSAMPGSILLAADNAASAEAAVEEVRRQHAQGADFVKLTAVSREVFLAAVAQARELGLPSAGHLPVDVSPSEAAESGFTCIEHLGAADSIWIECSSRADELAGRVAGADPLPVPTWITRIPGVDRLAVKAFQGRLVNPAAYTTEEARALTQEALDTFDEQRCRAMARRFVETRTWQVPTLVRLRTQELAGDPQYRTTDPWLALMTEQESQGWSDSLKQFDRLELVFHATFAQAYRLRLRVVGIWHEEGVPMMAGTDGQGRVPGQSLRQEFGELAAAGIPPLDVLRMATTAPATFLGRANRMGRIAPGMDADLLLLDDDPLTDVAHLSGVTAVVRGGHHLTRAELRRVIADEADRPADPPYASGTTCC